jgi:hypothetical protein
MTLDWMTRMKGSLKMARSDSRTRKKAKEKILDVFYVYQAKEERPISPERPVLNQKESSRSRGGILF